MDILKTLVFRQYLKSLAINNGDVTAAEAYASSNRSWLDGNKVERSLALSRNDPNLPAGDAGLAFVNTIRPKTIIGRLPLLRQAAFDVQGLFPTSAPEAHWVGEGAEPPNTALELGLTKVLERLKIVAVSYQTKELMASPAFNAENKIGHELEVATALGLDKAFIDPSNAGIANIMPMAITYNAPVIPATNSPADDIATAIAQYKGNVSSAAFVLHPKRAASLSLANSIFKNLGTNGGDIAGIVAVTSEACPLNTIALFDQSNILAAIDSYAGLAVATEGTVHLGNGEHVSLWQTNTVAMRSTVWANWDTMQNDAVVLITGG